MVQAIVSLTVNFNGRIVLGLLLIDLAKLSEKVAGTADTSTVIGGVISDIGSGFEREYSAVPRIQNFTGQQLGCFGRLEEWSN